MRIMESESPVLAPPRPGPLRLRVTDVTGSAEFEAEVQRSVPASAAAQTLAHRLQLPSDVTWSLRSDRGVFLDDAQPIGEQLEPDEVVSLTPKTHLG